MLQHKELMVLNTISGCLLIIGHPNHVPALAMLLVIYIIRMGWVGKPGKTHRFFNPTLLL